MTQKTVSRIPLCPGGPEVSQIVYGAWRLADDPSTANADTVAAIIEQCLELGITTFDHADIYGGYTCETLFGEVLKQKPNLRRQMELVTKCDICLPLGARPQYRVKHYDTSAAHITTSVDNSLTALGCEAVDVLLLHRPDPLLDADEAAKALHRLIEQGKVRAVGVSNFLPHQVDLLASRLKVPVVTNQLEVSVLAHGPLTDGTLDDCQRRRMRPMAWSPLAGGRLFDGDDPAAGRVLTVLRRLGNEMDASADQVALAWLLRHPAGIVPVVGSGKRERIAQAARAVRLELERQQWFEIYEAAMGRSVP